MQERHFTKMWSVFYIKGKFFKRTIFQFASFRNKIKKYRENKIVLKLLHREKDSWIIDIKKYFFIESMQLFVTSI